MKTLIDILLNYKHVKYFTICLMAIAVLSCEEVIDFEVEDIQQNIVIDGSITNTPENNLVKLSYSENAFKNVSPQKISGAKVLLGDNAGNWETLKEMSQGVFSISTISADYGSTYNLKVEYGGNIYSGSSTLMEPLKFDEINFEKTSHSFFGIVFDYYNAKFLITNDTGSDKYFLIKISSSNNGTIYSRTAYKITYTDGRQIEIKNTKYNFDKYASLRIDLITIDKNTYEYYSQLNTLSGNGDINVSNYLDMNSFNPKTNLSGGALGYFGAYSYKTYNVTVQ